MIDDFASRRKDVWSAETDKTILDMRAERLPWGAISERTGRTVEACCARYRVLVPKENRLRFRVSQRWTEKDTATIQRLIDENKSVKQICEAMNKPRKVVYNKIEYMRRVPRLIFTDLSSRVSVPPTALEDRDRRLAAEMDLTSEFFGDPRPGQSALDKKQGALA